ncbi:DUF4136 domain-containing protein [Mangrovivirga sp. M17]|uniref:DUF4136 domain-containing protein n=1 Tax=Mangrovivirga halotolerans TaxID=2993936 RepID=A0ABT3RUV5_9BACT|nr:DUF4136 domain-containing protein [Mangrovivirga halotolerans]MCX2745134.1 DUF4136 domain-containing protein [Mangrovivirga halotolerans]
MKYLNRNTAIKVMTVILAVLFTSSQVLSQNKIIDSDKRLNFDFEDYEYFEWASHATNEFGLYTLDNHLLKAKIRNAIEHEMEARGYEYMPGQDGLIINFRVFDKPTKFTGYIDTFQDENYWSSDEVDKEILGLVPEAEVREIEDKRTYYFEEGTLLVDIVNKKTGNLVWQGYASGMMDGEVLDADEEKITETVHELFDEEFFWESEVANR